MSEFRLVTAWQRGTRSQLAQVVAFWRFSGLIDPEEADDSAAGLCTLAYRGEHLAGASSIAFREFPPLRSRFAFCRLDVAAAYRRQGVATLLMRHTLTVMEAWSLDHPEERLSGLAAVIKTPDLRTKARHPVWSEYYGNLNLAGFTPNGGQVRVAWFRHAAVSPAQGG